MQASFRSSRRKPICAAIASLFALSAHVAAFAANSWSVTSCADTGTGSLRDVIGAGTTMSGDTVNLSTLSCPSSKISLTTGTITVAQDSLTIQGSSNSRLTIDASGLTTTAQSRAFTHNGTGTLSVRYLDVSGGYVNSTAAFSASGGCIYSNGSVLLHRATVKSCKAKSISGFNTANGGGIYTKGDLSLMYSTLSGNSAVTPNVAHGGGASVLGNFSATFSTVNGNSVSGPLGASVFAGGVFASGNVTITRSTVSANTSTHNIGGISAFSQTPGSLITQLNSSTISGNTAGGSIGGMYTDAGNVKIYNSTIAFNTAVAGTYSTGFVLSSAYSTSVSVNMQSSLLSNNTFGAFATESDLSTYGSHPITFNIAPANNLIRVTTASGLPTDTISSCPLLGSLRNNGGLTQTHALLSHSPAIDAGNAVHDNTYDQRGTPYQRVDNSKADIGAYEVQHSDIVFNTSFESCS
jgi:hypothetical protein